MGYLGQNNIINPTKWVWTGLSLVLRVIGWDGWRFSYFTGSLCIPPGMQIYTISMVFVFLVRLSTDLSKKQHYKWLKCFFIFKMYKLYTKIWKTLPQRTVVMETYMVFWQYTLPTLLHHHNYFTTIKISVIIQK